MPRTAVHCRALPCTAPSIPLLEALRPVFTEPTWKQLLTLLRGTLLRGTLLARGRRTVTAALWQTGHEQDPHFSAFHQVLNRARWSPLVPAARESALAHAHHPDLYPSGRHTGCGDR